MRRLALLLTVLALVLSLAACGDDDSSGTDGDEGTATTQADGGDDTASPGSDGSSFDDVAALRDALGEAGITCELDYEGLADEEREVSQCVINGEQAVISIWFEESLRDQVVDAVATSPGAVLAAGANWTVEVASPEVAQAVADAIDGELVQGPETTDTGGATTTTAA